MPSTSNDQDEIALVKVSGGSGSPQFDWIAERASAFGLICTVKSDPLHWEYITFDAENTRERGDFGNWA